MANRFWVGGTGTWDATTTTNWSDTSGGAGGASAPTSADDVYFDAGSDAGSPFTVTVAAGGINCNNFDSTGVDQAMVLAGSAASSMILNIHGDTCIFAASNFSITTSVVGGQLFLIFFLNNSSDLTLTTNGVNHPGVYSIDCGAVRKIILGSALNCRTLEFRKGIFDTANYNVTCRFIQKLFSASASQFLMGSSTVTCEFYWYFDGVHTINAGTSSLVITETNPISNGNFGPSNTYYDVSFTNTAVGNLIFNNTYTFNNLTFPVRSSNGIRQISFGGDITINGTLDIQSANTSAVRRTFIASTLVGTPRTITAATVATLADVDFRDIEGAGLGTWSGTRLGNCLGNTGITFDAGKDVYRVGNGNWSATQWSLTSGGSVDVNNFPLAQDTAIFDTGTTTGTHTIDAAWNIGNLDMSALNVAVTLATGGQQPNIHGDVTLDADVTLTGTGQLQFTGASNQTVTSAGKTFTQPFNINKPTTTSLILGDALTSNLGFTLTQGTLNLNDFDLTSLIFTSNNTNTRSIAFGTSKINVTGNATTIINFSNPTNFTYTGSPNFELTYSGGDGARNVRFGNDLTPESDLEANAINITVLNGSDIFAIFLGSTFTKLRNLIFADDFSGTFGDTINPNFRAIGFIYGNLRLSSAMSLNMSPTTPFRLSGSLGTQQITTNGQTLDFPVIKIAGSTLELQDNLTMGSTSTLTHEAGTIDLNDNTLTTGVYSATGSLDRSIDFGTGTLAVGGNFTASGSNYTTAGTGSVSMTSASGKTFAGGNFTYPTLNQGGAGTLTITGANTFNNITNTNATASTITFPASTVTRVLNMKLKGNISNLVSMRSSIDGTTYTIQT
jgi:hypothetical protein